jgi:hypothetical protein
MKDLDKLPVLGLAVLIGAVAATHKQGDADATTSVIALAGRPETVLAASSDAQAPTLAAANQTPEQRWRITPTEQRGEVLLRHETSSRCLTASGTGYATLTSCADERSAPAQRWRVRDASLRNVATGSCLSAEDGATLAPCPTTGAWRLAAL